jgi:trimeric autotransporter adhesin
MKRVQNLVGAFILAVCATAVLPAQPAAKTTTSVPRLVKYSGTLADISGKPLSGVVGVTFALYEEERGGAPLWMETQNVQADGGGHYTVLLGSTRNDGVPAEAFASGERWLGVEPQGETEGQRVLMTSVPYSLKAVDAETLGGLPASAFALAGTAGSGAVGASIASSRAVAATGATKPEVSPETTPGGTGTAGTIAIWTATSTLGNSVITQRSGDIGIGGSPVANFKLTVENATENGIYSDTGSATGIAVWGAASADSGTTSGVFGVSASPDGDGVSGDNSATSGVADGVLGSSASPEGNGVQGINIATTGNASGVFGTTASTAGSGVQGDASADSGETNGVLGTNSSPDGNGVQGSNSAASGTGTGVYGNVVSPDGVAVYGEATATSGDNIGVYGATASESGLGVQGEATAESGSSFGVDGVNSSTAGIGVQGHAAATSGTTFGTTGISDSTSGTGVQGKATAASGTVFGVTGTAASSTGTGVQGQNTATSGVNYGVVGIAASTTGAGVHGQVTATSGINYGVVGTSASSQGVGVYGYGATHSTLGGLLAGNAAGVWGDTHSGSAGVFASADDAEAVAAYNNATNVATMFVENQEDSIDTANVFATFSSYGGYCDIAVSGNLTCSGSVGGHAFVGPDSSREVAVYAMQSPENWFEDAGSGQLHNGAVVVKLDAEYAQTVNTTMDYKVFLTPNGDCKGLYVSGKSPTSFEVHELGGGTSSIAFDYRIMAKRKGYEKIRLADLTGKIQRGPDLRAAGQGAPERALPGFAAIAAGRDNNRAKRMKARGVRKPTHAAKLPVRAPKPALSGAALQPSASR